MGSGVLLAFAAKSGALDIDGVEAVADAAALARETLKNNALQDKVHLHETLVENLDTNKSSMVNDEQGNVLSW